MRIALLIAIVLLALPIAGCAVKSSRNTQPLFKGVELYSWTDSATGSWQFSLCEGTNRKKALAEITHKCKAIRGVSSLKEHLAALAIGESVFWSSSYPELTFPREPIVRDLIDHAAAHQVKLLVAK
ncbi:MAG: hypothetical protein ABIS45_14415 [Burkholderiales bacterium]